MSEPVHKLGELPNAIEQARTAYAESCENAVRATRELMLGFERVGRMAGDVSQLDTAPVGIREVARQAAPILKRLAEQVEAILAKGPKP